MTIEYQFLSDATDDTLDKYLDDLNSPETPPHIKSVWIISRLPDISTSRLRDWIRDGVISPKLGNPGRGRHRLFTQEEAKRIGHIWYYNKKGARVRSAAAQAQSFLQDEDLYGSS